MGPGETIDTGQKEVKQKKFVSIKQKIAAKKLKKHGAKKPTKSTGPKTSAATPLFDNDPVSANSTIGSANRPPQFPAKKNSEVRRPGWNRQAIGPGITVSPLNVFGAELPSSPPSRNVRMLKIGLGVLGGIALLLGALASILYISKKRRKQKRRSNQNRKRSDGTTTTGTTVGLPPHPQYPQHGHPQMPCGEYSQYPPNGWQNSLNPYGPQMHNNYNQLPYQGQLPNPAYYGMPFDPYGGQYQIAPGFYPQMNGFHEMGPNGYYPNCDGYGPNGEVAQYPESQGGLSEVGFDPVLNYVETLGDELKTPKRRPKQRKEGSSTPHPIITRRASCKSIKSEISAWTEDEDAMSKAESTYVSPETISLKGSHSGKEDTTSQKNHKLDGESTKSSPQLSQTNDSAYGSRGSIQSPNSVPLVIPPFGMGHEGKQVSVQNVPVPVVPNISQYMVDPYNRKMLSISGTVSQYSTTGQVQQTPINQEDPDLADR